MLQFLCFNFLIFLFVVVCFLNYCPYFYKTQGNNHYLFRTVFHCCVQYLSPVCSRYQYLVYDRLFITSLFSSCDIMHLFVFIVLNIVYFSDNCVFLSCKSLVEIPLPISLLFLCFCKICKMFKVRFIIRFTISSSKLKVKLYKNQFELTRPHIAPTAYLEIIKTFFSQLEIIKTFLFSFLRLLETQI